MFLFLLCVCIHLWICSSFTVNLNPSSTSYYRNYKEFSFTNSVSDSGVCNGDWRFTYTKPAFSTDALITFRDRIGGSLTITAPCTFTFTSISVTCNSNSQCPNYIDAYFYNSQKSTYVHPIGFMDITQSSFPISLVSTDPYYEGDSLVFYLSNDTPGASAVSISGISIIGGSGVLSLPFKYVQMCRSLSTSCATNAECVGSTLLSTCKCRNGYYGDGYTLCAPFAFPSDMVKSNVPVSIGSASEDLSASTFKVSSVSGYLTTPYATFFPSSNHQCAGSNFEIGIDIKTAAEVRSIFGTNTLSLMDTPALTTANRPIPASPSVPVTTPFVTNDPSILFSSLSDNPTAIFTALVPAKGMLTIRIDLGSSCCMRPSHLGVLLPPDITTAGQGPAVFTVFAEEVSSTATSDNLKMVNVGTLSRSSVISQSGTDLAGTWLVVPLSISDQSDKSYFPSVFEIRIADTFVPQEFQTATWALGARAANTISSWGSFVVSISRIQFLFQSATGRIQSKCYNRCDTYNSNFASFVKNNTLDLPTCPLGTVCSRLDGGRSTGRCICPSGTSSLTTTAIPATTTLSTGFSTVASNYCSSLYPHLPIVDSSVYNDSSVFSAVKTYVDSLIYFRSDLIRAVGMGISNSFGSALSAIDYKDSMNAVGIKMDQTNILNLFTTASYDSWMGGIASVRSSFNCYGDLAVMANVSNFVFNSGWNPFSNNPQLARKLLRPPTAPLQMLSVPHYAFDKDPTTSFTFLRSSLPVVITVKLPCCSTFSSVSLFPINEPGGRRLVKYLKFRIYAFTKADSNEPGDFGRSSDTGTLKTLIFEGFGTTDSITGVVKLPISSSTSVTLIDIVILNAGFSSISSSSSVSTLASDFLVTESSYPSGKITPSPISEVIRISEIAFEFLSYSSECDCMTRSCSKSCTTLSSDVNAICSDSSLELIPTGYPYEANILNNRQHTAVSSLYNPYLITGAGSSVTDTMLSLFFSTPSTPSSVASACSGLWTFVLPDSGSIIASSTLPAPAFARTTDADDEYAWTFLINNEQDTILDIIGPCCVVAKGLFIDLSVESSEESALLSLQVMSPSESITFSPVITLDSLPSDKVILFSSSSSASSGWRLVMKQTGALENDIPLRVMIKFPRIVVDSTIVADSPSSCNSNAVDGYRQVSNSISTSSLLVSIRDFASSCDISSCSANSYCSSSSTCSCLTGYVGDGINCVQVTTFPPYISSVTTSASSGLSDNSFKMYFSPASLLPSSALDTAMASNMQSCFGEYYSRISTNSSSVLANSNDRDPYYWLDDDDTTTISFAGKTVDLQLSLPCCVIVSGALLRIPLCASDSSTCKNLLSTVTLSISVLADSASTTSWTVIGTSITNLSSYVVSGSSYVYIPTNAIPTTSSRFFMLSISADSSIDNSPYNDLFSYIKSVKLTESTAPSSRLLTSCVAACGGTCSASNSCTFRVTPDVSVCSCATGYLMIDNTCVSAVSPTTTTTIEQFYANAGFSMIMNSKSVTCGSTAWYFAHYLSSSSAFLGPTCDNAATLFDYGSLLKLGPLKSLTPTASSYSYLAFTITFSCNAQFSKVFFKLPLLTDSTDGVVLTRKNFPWAIYIFTADYPLKKSSSATAYFSEAVLQPGAWISVPLTDTTPYAWSTLTVAIYGNVGERVAISNIAFDKFTSVTTNDFSCTTDYCTFTRDPSTSTFSQVLTFSKSTSTDVPDLSSVTTSSNSFTIPSGKCRGTWVTSSSNVVNYMTGSSSSTMSSSEYVRLPCCLKGTVAVNSRRAIKITAYSLDGYNDYATTDSSNTLNDATFTVSYAYSTLMMTYSGTNSRAMTTMRLTGVLDCFSVASPQRYNTCTDSTTDMSYYLGYPTRVICYKYSNSNSYKYFLFVGVNKYPLWTSTTAPPTANDPTKLFSSSISTDWVSGGGVDLLGDSTVKIYIRILPTSSKNREIGAIVLRAPTQAKNSYLYPTKVQVDLYLTHEDLGVSNSFNFDLKSDPYLGEEEVLHLTDSGIVSGSSNDARVIILTFTPSTLSSDNSISLSSIGYMDNGDGSSITSSSTGCGTSNSLPTSLSFVGVTASSVSGLANYVSAIKVSCASNFSPIDSTVHNGVWYFGARCYSTGWFSNTWIWDYDFTTLTSVRCIPTVCAIDSSTLSNLFKYHYFPSGYSAMVSLSTTSDGKTALRATCSAGYGIKTSLLEYSSSGVKRSTVTYSSSSTTCSSNSLIISTISSACEASSSQCSSMSSDAAASILDHSDTIYFNSLLSTSSSSTAGTLSAGTCPSGFQTPTIPPSKSLTCTAQHLDRYAWLPSLTRNAGWTDDTVCYRSNDCLTSTCASNLVCLPNPDTGRQCVCASTSCLSTTPTCPTMTVAELEAAIAPYLISGTAPSIINPSISTSVTISVGCEDGYNLDPLPQSLTISCIAITSIDALQLSTSTQAITALSQATTTFSSIPFVSYQLSITFPTVQCTALYCDSDTSGIPNNGRILTDDTSASTIVGHTNKILISCPAGYATNDLDETEVLAVCTGTDFNAVEWVPDDSSDICKAKICSTIANVTTDSLASLSPDYETINTTAIVGTSVEVSCPEGMMYTFANGTQAGSLTPTYVCYLDGSVPQWPEDMTSGTCEKIICATDNITIVTTSPFSTPQLPSNETYIKNHLAVTCETGLPAVLVGSEVIYLPDSQDYCGLSSLTPFFQWEYASLGSLTCAERRCNTTSIDITMASTFSSLNRQFASVSGGTQSNVGDGVEFDVLTVCYAGYADADGLTSGFITMKCVDGEFQLVSGLECLGPAECQDVPSYYKKMPFESSINSQSYYFECPTGTEVIASHPNSPDVYNSTINCKDEVWSHKFHSNLCIDPNSTARTPFTNSIDDEEDSLIASIENCIAGSGRTCRWRLNIPSDATISSSMQLYNYTYTYRNVKTSSGRYQTGTGTNVLATVQTNMNNTYIYVELAPSSSVYPTWSSYGPLLSSALVYLKVDSSTYRELGLVHQFFFPEVIVQWDTKRAFTAVGTDAPSDNFGRLFIRASSSCSDVSAPMFAPSVATSAAGTISGINYYFPYYQNFDSTSSWSICLALSDVDTHISYTRFNRVGGSIGMQALAVDFGSYTVVRAPFEIPLSNPSDSVSIGSSVNWLINRPIGTTSWSCYMINDLNAEDRDVAFKPGSSTVSLSLGGVFGFCVSSADGVYSYISPGFLPVGVITPGMESNSTSELQDISVVFPLVYFNPWSHSVTDVLVGSKASLSDSCSFSSLTAVVTTVLENNLYSVKINGQDALSSTYLCISYSADGSTFETNIGRIVWYQSLTDFVAPVVTDEDYIATPVDSSYLVRPYTFANTGDNYLKMSVVIPSSRRRLKYITAKNNHQEARDSEFTNMPFASEDLWDSVRDDEFPYSPDEVIFMSSEDNDYNGDDNQNPDNYQNTFSSVSSSSSSIDNDIGFDDTTTALSDIIDQMPSAHTKRPHRSPLNDRDFQAETADSLIHRRKLYNPDVDEQHLNMNTFKTNSDTPFIQETTSSVLFAGVNTRIIDEYWFSQIVRTGQFMSGSSTALLVPVYTEAGVDCSMCSASSLYSIQRSPSNATVEYYMIHLCPPDVASACPGGDTSVSKLDMTYRTTPTIELDSSAEFLLYPGYWMNQTHPFTVKDGTESDLLPTSAVSVRMEALDASNSATDIISDSFVYPIATGNFNYIEDQIEPAIIPGTHTSIRLTFTFKRNKQDESLGSTSISQTFTLPIVLYTQTFSVVDTATGSAPTSVYYSSSLQLTSSIFRNGAEDSTIPTLSVFFLSFNACADLTTSNLAGSWRSSESDYYYISKTGQSAEIRTISGSTLSVCVVENTWPFFDLVDPSDAVIVHQYSTSQTLPSISQYTSVDTLSDFNSLVTSVSSSSSYSISYHPYNSANLYNCSTSDASFTPFASDGVSVNVGGYIFCSTLPNGLLIPLGYVFVFQDSSEFLPGDYYFEALTIGDTIMISIVLGPSSDTATISSPKTAAFQRYSTTSITSLTCNSKAQSNWSWSTELDITTSPAVILAQMTGTITSTVAGRTYQFCTGSTVQPYVARIKFGTNFVTAAPTSLTVRIGDDFSFSFTGSGYSNRPRYGVIRPASFDCTTTFSVVEGNYMVFNQNDPSYDQMPLDYTLDFNDMVTDNSSATSIFEQVYSISTTNARFLRSSLSSETDFNSFKVCTCPFATCAESDFVSSHTISISHWYQLTPSTDSSAFVIGESYVFPSSSSVTEFGDDNNYIRLKFVNTDTSRAACTGSILTDLYKISSVTYVPSEFTPPKFYNSGSFELCGCAKNLAQNFNCTSDSDFLVPLHKFDFIGPSVVWKKLTMTAQSTDSSNTIFTVSVDGFRMSTPSIVDSTLRLVPTTALITNLEDLFTFCLSSSSMTYYTMSPLSNTATTSSMQYSLDMYNVASSFYAAFCWVNAAGDIVPVGVTDAVPGVNAASFSALAGEIRSYSLTGTLILSTMTYLIMVDNGVNNCTTLTSNSTSSLILLGTSPKYVKTQGGSAISGIALMSTGNYIVCIAPLGPYMSNIVDRGVKISVEKPVGLSSSTLVNVGSVIPITLTTSTYSFIGTTSTTQDLRLRVMAKSGQTYSECYSDVIGSTAATAHSPQIYGSSSFTTWASKSISFSVAAHASAGVSTRKWLLCGCTVLEQSTLDTCIYTTSLGSFSSQNQMYSSQYARIDGRSTLTYSLNYLSYFYTATQYTCPCSGSGCTLTPQSTYSSYVTSSTVLGSNQVDVTTTSSPGDKIYICACLSSSCEVYSYLGDIIIFGPVLSSDTAILSASTIRTMNIAMTGLLLNSTSLTYTLYSWTDDATDDNMFYLNSLRNKNLCPSTYLTTASSTLTFYLDSSSSSCTGTACNLVADGFVRGSDRYYVCYQHSSRTDSFPYGILIAYGPNHQQQFFGLVTNAFDIIVAGYGFTDTNAFTVVDADTDCGLSGTNIFPAYVTADRLGTNDTFTTMDISLSLTAGVTEFFLKLCWMDTTQDDETLYTFPLGDLTVRMYMTSAYDDIASFTGYYSINPCFVDELGWLVIPDSRGLLSTYPTTDDDRWEYNGTDVNKMMGGINTEETPFQLDFGEDVTVGDTTTKIGYMHDLGIETNSPITSDGPVSTCTSLYDADFNHNGGYFVVAGIYKIYIFKLDSRASAVVTGAQIRYHTLISTGSLTSTTTNDATDFSPLAVQVSPTSLLLKMSTYIAQFSITWSDGVPSISNQLSTSLFSSSSRITALAVSDWVLTLSTVVINSDFKVAYIGLATGQVYYCKFNAQVFPSSCSTSTLITATTSSTPVFTLGIRKSILFASYFNDDTIDIFRLTAQEKKLVETWNSPYASFVLDRSTSTRGIAFRGPDSVFNSSLPVSFYTGGSTTSLSDSWLQIEAVDGYLICFHERYTYSQSIEVSILRISDAVGLPTAIYTDNFVEGRAYYVPDYAPIQYMTIEKPNGPIESCKSDPEFNSTILSFKSSDSSDALSFSIEINGVGVMNSETFSITCYNIAGQFTTSISVRIRCDDGYFYNNATSVCEECPLNTYIDYSLNMLSCQSCPDSYNTTSTASTSADDCLCAKGYEATSTDSETYLALDEAYRPLTSCSACAAGSFKDSISNDVACGGQCPTLSSSDVTAATTRLEMNCVCPAGYYLENANSTSNVCTACVVGDPEYCEDGQNIFYCPENSVAESAQASTLYQCKCNVGYGFVANDPSTVITTTTTIDQGTCVACVVNNYKVGIENTACSVTCPGERHAIGTGSTAASDCVYCYPGWYHVLDSSECTICPIGYYCLGSLGESVDDYNTAHEGDDVETTDDGSVAVVGQNIYACPNTTTTVQEGASSGTECGCSRGYGFDGTSCVECPINTFKDFTGNATCTTCPAQLITLVTTATSIDSCVCASGSYYASDQSDAPAGWSCSYCSSFLYTSALQVSNTSASSMTLSDCAQACVDLGSSCTNFAWTESSASPASLAATYDAFTNITIGYQCTGDPYACTETTTTSTAIPVGTPSKTDLSGYILEVDTTSTANLGVCQLLSSSASSASKFVGYPTLCDRLICEQKTEQNYKCTECDVDYYCLGNRDSENRHVSKAACMDNSESPAGAYVETMCLCSLGFYYKDSYSCEECSSGTYTDVLNRSPSCSACSATDAEYPMESLSPPVSQNTCYCPEGSYHESVYDAVNSITTLWNSSEVGVCKTCIESLVCDGGLFDNGTHVPPQSCGTGMSIPTGDANTRDNCQCLPGYYLGGSTCIKCPSGSYNVAHESQDTCRGRCMDNSASIEGSSSMSQCFCQKGFFLKLPSSSVVDTWEDNASCDSCPSGGECVGGLQQDVYDKIEEDNTFTDVTRFDHPMPYPLSGYYRLFTETDIDDREDTDLIAACPVPSACEGGELNTCYKSMEGLACFSCKAGFARKSITAVCGTCPSASLTLMMYGAYTVAMLGYTVIMAQMSLESGFTRKTLHSLVIKSITSYVLGIRSINTFQLSDMKWPDVIANLLGSSSSASASTAYLNLECFFRPDGSTDAYQNAFFSNQMFEFLNPLLQPLLITIFAAALIPIYRVLKSEQIQEDIDTLNVLSSDLLINRPLYDALLLEKSSMRVVSIWRFFYPPGSNFSTQVKFFIEDSFPVYIYALISVHASVTNEMIKLIQCQTGVDGVSRLKYAYDVVCNSSEHQFYYNIGWLGLFLWSVGIPVFSISLFFRHKHRMFENFVRQRYGFLNNGYNLRHWYWEAVVMVRKVLILLFSSFYIGTDDRIKIALLFGVVFVFLIIQLVRRPYDGRSIGVLNNLEELSMFCLAMSLLIFEVAFLYNYNVSFNVFLMLGLLGFNLWFFGFAVTKLLEEISHMLTTKPNLAQLPAPIGPAVGKLLDYSEKVKLGRPKIRYDMLSNMISLEGKDGFIIKRSIEDLEEEFQKKALDILRQNELEKSKNDDYGLFSSSKIEALLMSDDNSKNDEDKKKKNGNDSSSNSDESSDSEEGNDQAANYATDNNNSKKNINNHTKNLIKDKNGKFTKKFSKKDPDASLIPDLIQSQDFFDNLDATDDVKAQQKQEKILKNEAKKAKRRKKLLKQIHPFNTFFNDYLANTINEAVEYALINLRLPSLPGDFVEFFMRWCFVSHHLAVTEGGGNDGSNPIANKQKWDRRFAIQNFSLTKPTKSPPSRLLVSGQAAINLKVRLVKETEMITKLIQIAVKYLNETRSSLRKEILDLESKMALETTSFLDKRKLKKRLNEIYEDHPDIKLPLEEQSSLDRVIGARLARNARAYFHEKYFREPLTVADIYMGLTRLQLASPSDIQITYHLFTKTKVLVFNMDLLELQREVKMTAQQVSILKSGFALQTDKDGLSPDEQVQKVMSEHSKIQEQISAAQESISKIESLKPAIQREMLLLNSAMESKTLDGLKGESFIEIPPHMVREILSLRSENYVSIIADESLRKDIALDRIDKVASIGEVLKNTLQDHDEFDRKLNTSHIDDSHYEDNYDSENDDDDYYDDGDITNSYQLNSVHPENSKLSRKHEKEAMKNTAARMASLFLKMEESHSLSVIQRTQDMMLGLDGQLTEVEIKSRKDMALKHSMANKLESFNELTDAGIQSRSNKNKNLEASAMKIDNRAKQLANLSVTSKSADPTGWVSTIRESVNRSLPPAGKAGESVNNDDDFAESDSSIDVSSSESSMHDVANLKPALQGVASLHTVNDDLIDRFIDQNDRIKERNDFSYDKEDDDEVQEITFQTIKPGEIDQFQSAVSDTNQDFNSAKASQLDASKPQQGSDWASAAFSSAKHSRIASHSELKSENPSDDESSSEYSSSSDSSSGSSSGSDSGSSSTFSVSSKNSSRNSQGSHNHGNSSSSSSEASSSSSS